MGRARRASASSCGCRSSSSGRSTSSCSRGSGRCPASTISALALDEDEFESTIERAEEADLRVQEHGGRRTFVSTNAGYRLELHPPRDWIDELLEQGDRLRLSELHLRADDPRAQGARARRAPRLPARRRRRRGRRHARPLRARRPAGPARAVRRGLRVTESERRCSPPSPRGSTRCPSGARRGRRCLGCGEDDVRRRARAAACGRRRCASRSTTSTARRRSGTRAANDRIRTTTTRSICRRLRRALEASTPGRSPSSTASSCCDRSSRTSGPSRSSSTSTARSRSSAQSRATPSSSAARTPRAAAMQPATSPARRSISSDADPPRAPTSSSRTPIPIGHDSPS